MPETVNNKGVIYTQQSNEDSGALMQRAMKGITDAQYKPDLGSQGRSKAISDANAKSVAETGSELDSTQRKAIFDYYSGNTTKTPTDIAKEYGFPDGAGVELKLINGKPTPVMTSFNGKPLPLGTGNSDNGKVKITTVDSPMGKDAAPPVTDDERTAYQKQISTLQDGVNSYRDAAESLRVNTLKAMKDQEQSLNQNFTNLKMQLGDRFAQVQNAIANVEAKTGREVQITPDFAAKVNQFATAKTDPAAFQTAIEHLAGSFAVDPKADRFGQYYSTPAGQQFQKTNGSVNDKAAAGAPVAQIPEQNVPGSTTGMVAPPAPTAADPLMKFDPKSATGSTAALLADPNSTSEQILLSLYGNSADTIDQNTLSVLDFLTKSNQKTRDSEDEYSALLAANKAQVTDFLGEQKDASNAKYDLLEDQIKAEEVNTMGDMQNKRSRIEGYMKAKLKSQGILDGSFGFNEYVTSITQYDTLMRNTQQSFDFKLRQNDIDRTTDMLALTDKLITINNDYAEKEFQFHFTSEQNIDANLLKGLQTVNEANVDKAKLFSDTSKDIIQVRQDRAKALADAVKQAQDRADKRAEDMTKNSGFVYQVDGDNKVVLFTDDKGNPMKTWDRTNAEADLELKGQQLTLQQKQENFDEWYKQANVSIDRAQANAQITKIQADIMRDNLKEGRDQQEFQWKQDDRTDAKGYQPSGQVASANINGRNLTLDTGALQSAEKMNQILAPFGGLRIGAQDSATTRDQAQTIKAMADRFKVPFDAKNPNNTAAKLRAAGHQIADVGASNHEKGIAMDLYPDQAYINQVKPYLLANGWTQPIPNGDAGHFEFVGGKANNVKDWEKVEIGNFIGQVFNGRTTSPGADQIKQFQTDLEGEWSTAKASGQSLDDFLKQFKQTRPSGGSSDTSNEDEGDLLNPKK